MQLKKIAKRQTYDVTTLEFDFIPSHNLVSFRYVFGSDEYPEFVGSKYNDCFGIWVDGNEYRDENVALAKNKQEITINNVNHLINRDLFRRNSYKYSIGHSNASNRLTELGSLVAAAFTKNIQVKDHEIIYHKQKKDLDPWLMSHIELDGLTQVIESTFYVEPYKVYHFKIGIADVGDHHFDSGVFLLEGSFSSREDTTQPNYTPTLAQDMDMSDFDTTQEETPVVIPIPDPMKLNVHFASASYALSDEEKNALDNLATHLHLSHYKYSCNLIGHTDNVGLYEYNMELSKNRAHAVYEYLISKGIPKDAFIKEGESFTQPVVSNTNEMGRRENRRVEIQVEYEKQELVFGNW